MTDRQVLVYGSTTRLRRHRQIVLGLCAASLLALLVLVVSWLDSPPRWLAMWEVNGVRASLKSIPTVRSVEVYYGHDSPAFMCEIYDVETWLNGEGDRVFCLGTTSTTELSSGSHFRLARLGPYLLKATMPDGSKKSIDIGAKGPFSSLLPFQLRSAKDLVNHYDDLLKFFAALPPVSTHKSQSGEVYELHVSPVPPPNTL